MASNVLERVLAGLEGIVGERWVLRSPPLLAGYTRDYWPLLVVGELSGRVRPAPLPAAVVMPGSEEEVSRVVEVLREHRVPLVVYNGGSGVLGGALPQSGDWIVLDPGRLRWIEWYDESAGLVWAGAGVHMEELEDWLGERGFTSRHCPQSMSMARLGGLIATRSSGVYSTGYGGIEERVKGVHAAVPGVGLVRVRPAPRRSVLWSLTQLFTGSEGFLGVITSAYLEVFPEPECQVPFSVVYPGFREALESARRLVQSRSAPELLRVFDERESLLFHGVEGSLLIGVYEGSCETVEARLEAFDRITGRRPGDSSLATKWLRERTHVIPRIRALYKEGLGFDTIEVAATWGRLWEMHNAIMEGLASIDGLVYASVHSGHFYPSGAALYYTIVYELDKLPRVYHEAWDRVTRLSSEHGGTISHHHGLGTYRLKWLELELGREGLEIVKRIKRALDDDGILRDKLLY